MKRPTILASLFVVFVFTLLTFAVSASGHVQPSVADADLRLRTQIHPFHDSRLVYKFIEQYWAPSTTSEDLVAALNASKRIPRSN